MTVRSIVCVFFKCYDNYRHVTVFYCHGIIRILYCIQLWPHIFSFCMCRRSCSRDLLYRRRKGIKINRRASLFYASYHWISPACRILRMAADRIQYHMCHTVHGSYSSSVKRTKRENIFRDFIYNDWNVFCAYSFPYHICHDPCGRIQFGRCRRFDFNTWRNRSTD